MPSAKKTTNKITYQAGKGFKKCIGTYIGPDGRRRPRIFWLGHDERAALSKVDRLINDIYPQPWAAINGVWTAKGLEAAKDELSLLTQGWNDIAEFARNYANEFDGKAPTRGNTRIESYMPAAGEKTLYQAIEAYKTSIRGKRFSDRHKERAVQVMEINVKRVRRDCPLRDIDFAWIDTLCDHYKNRPKNLRDGAPMKPAGVKNVLTYIRLFFTWLDDTEFGSWQAPRKMLKCFKVRTSDLMTDAELRSSTPILQFDIATLRTLYRAATDRQRTWMLMALFTGATQAELAVMEKNEFDLDTAMLTHYRHKTKVLGAYWLPPELVKLLREEFSARPNDTLAFRTAEGHPLVTCRDGRQTSDAVRQMWDDLRDSAGVPQALSFKYLRKFLADWMIRHGGEEMGQVALSHSRQSVLARSYTSNRQFDRFNELQREMHRELRSAKLFDVQVSSAEAA